MHSRHRMDVQLDVDPFASRAPVRERRRSPVSVLLVGDFRGRDSKEPAAPGSLRTRPVDRDTVDEVMEALAPTLRLADGTELTFRCLDDLHPDELIDRIPRVGAILDGREAALPPRRESDREAEASASPPPPRGDVLGAILDQVAGPAAPSPREPAAPPPGSIRAFAAEAARHDTVREPGAEERARALSARERAGEALREVLASPGFRALERRWRGVDFLVRRLETGPDLHVHLVDLSRGSLAAELEAEDGLEASALRSLLRAGKGPDGDPWSLVVMMDGSFGADPADQTLLAWVTGLCGAYGSTVVVDGEPELAGIPGWHEATEPAAWGTPDPAWAAFRRQPEARALGVALPGFLLRVPYGADTAPVDGLPFEEVRGAPSRDDYVWGGGALACALVLAREAVRDDGGGLPDDRIGELPLHMWRSGVDSGTTCGAVAMTDGAARRLMESGLVPVAWARGDDAVRVLIPRSAAGTPLWLGGGEG